MAEALKATCFHEENTNVFDKCYREQHLSKAFPGCVLSFHPPGFNIHETNYGNFFFVQFFDAAASPEFAFDAAPDISYLDARLFYTDNNGNPISSFDDTPITLEKRNGMLKDISGDPLAEGIPKFPVIKIKNHAARIQQVVDWDTSPFDSKNSTKPVARELYNMHLESKLVQRMSINPSRIVYWTRKLLSRQVLGLNSIQAREPKDIATLIQACAQMVIDAVDDQAARDGIPKFRQFFCDNPTELKDALFGSAPFQALTVACADGSNIACADGSDFIDLGQAVSGPGRDSQTETLRLQLLEWMRMSKLIASTYLAQQKWQEGIDAMPDYF